MRRVRNYHSKNLKKDSLSVQFLSSGRWLGLSDEAADAFQARLRNVARRAFSSRDTAVEAHRLPCNRCRNFEISGQRPPGLVACVKFGKRLETNWQVVPSAAKGQRRVHWRAPCRISGDMVPYTRGWLQSHRPQLTKSFAGKGPRCTRWQ